MIHAILANSLIHPTTQPSIQPLTHPSNHSAIHPTTQPSIQPLSHPSNHSAFYPTTQLSIQLHFQYPPMHPHTINLTILPSVDFSKQTLIKTHPSIILLIHLCFFQSLVNLSILSSSQSSILPFTHPSIRSSIHPSIHLAPTHATGVVVLNGQTWEGESHFTPLHDPILPPSLHGVVAMCSVQKMLLVHKR